VQTWRFLHLLKVGLEKREGLASDQVKKAPNIAVGAKRYGY